MDVNGVVSLYTTLFGWHFYDILWAVLAASGLIYVPILVTVFTVLMRSREQGSVFSATAESGVSQLEVRLFSLLLVLMLAAVPTGATTISAQKLSYDGATPGNAQSTYDQTFGLSPLVTGTRVQIPVWWYFTMAVSSGITKAVSKAASSDLYFRDLETALSIASIRDPQIRYQLQLFGSECFVPARSRLYRENSQQDYRDSGEHWVGSVYFRTSPGYYDVIRTQTPVAGFSYNAATMPEFSGDPKLGGRPTCNAFWDRLSGDILAQAAADGITRKWYAYFGNDEKQNQRIIERYVQSEQFRVMQSADEINAVRAGGSDNNAVLSAVSTIGGMAVAASLAKTVLLLRSTVSAVVYGASTVQAYILMVLYLTIPIALLASGYSLAYLLNGALLIFTVTFWSALWTIAALADNFLSSALWGELLSSSLANKLDPENITKDLIHSVVVMGLYTLMPLAASWMILASGSGASRAVMGAAAPIGTSASMANNSWPRYPALSLRGKK